MRLRGIKSQLQMVEAGVVVVEEEDQPLCACPKLQGQRV